MPESLLNMTIEQLCDAVAAAGEKPYRAKQLADWVYRKAVTDPAKMTNLPAGLTERFEILPSRIVGRADSKDGTIKLLVELVDGRHIETVAIPTTRRVTACLSTQVGCAMGCSFCASAIGGMQRNCSAGEILQQILHLHQAVGRKITHVVFMGMGEPLANYNATVQAIRAIIDPKRFGLSARRVTVSTVGLPAAIRRLAKENLPITLAISLHAPDDRLRRKLIPAAVKTPLEQILAAAEAFHSSRNRQVTLEYLLLDGVNDNTDCAEVLIGIARRLSANVNLIRYNPVASLPYHRPPMLRVQKFAERLTSRGVPTEVRRSRGLDTAAACGQLRRRHAETTESKPQRKQRKINGNLKKSRSSGKGTKKK